MMPVKWTVEDYHQMVAAGILTNRRVELLSGEILEMAPEGPLHRFVNVTAAKYLRQILQGIAEVYEAHPVTLPDSEPEPDIAIVHQPDSRYLTHHPFPQEIYWLVEISDSTLTDDLERKTKVYADAGIEEYWVIDVKAKTLWVFRQPGLNGYQEQTQYTDGTITPVAFPKIQVSVVRMLGRAMN